MTGWRSQATEPLSAATVRDEAWRRIGPVRLDRVVPERDALVLHHWLTHPASAFWQMTDLGLDEVLAYERRLAGSTDEHAWIGRVAGRPAFMVETYDPSRVLLKGVYRARTGDVGMHLLVAPPEGPRLHGLTDAVMAATMRFCFGTLRAQRVVVEPDVRNTAIAAKNAAAGFRVVREVDLPGKRAALSVCTRDDFAASRLGATATHEDPR
ncbi:GNAT family N-acetyltransferase [Cellulomonas sp. 179-A 9B4 NHS]|uniref:GNAT family N-acetyltransferase n=1 Tax=Cellulomonas sp. 179-A 9B4 NHS TaxID=3142379 RepID=UPI0039A3C514